MSSIPKEMRQRAIVRWLEPPTTSNDDPFMILLCHFRDEHHVLIQLAPPQFDCPACQRNFKEEAKFCSRCGKPLRQFKVPEPKSSLKIRENQQ